ncbi:MAG: hypothetical protein L0Z62_34640 [Gemmataceae bacterium]|nr:hypothetical protein [Gemmataceae bacterium]
MYDHDDEVLEVAQDSPAPAPVTPAPLRANPRDVLLRLVGGLDTLLACWRDHLTPDEAMLALRQLHAQALESLGL